MPEEFPLNGILTNDKGGLRIPTDAGITVSDYLGYGSYSGTDIKAVVHLPADPNLVADINARKAQLEAQLNEYEAATPTSKLDYTNTNAAIDTLSSEINNLAAEATKFSIPKTIVLGELQTLSWSVFRDLIPVRTFGAVYPRSLVKNSRTIGGSMIFTVFYEHALHEILELNLGQYNTGTSDRDNFKYTTNLPDQLPPLDISIICVNEYGSASHMGLWGVNFCQEGGTFSVEDIFSENVMQYQARDIDPLRIAGRRKINGQGVTDYWQTTASTLFSQSDSSISHLIRRNPFI